MVRIPTKADIPEVINMSDGSVVLVESLTPEQRQKIFEIYKSVQDTVADVNREHMQRLVDIRQDFHATITAQLAAWRQERE